MRRIYICPYCNSEKTEIEGYDDEAPVIECFDCGHKFYADETDKVWEDDGDENQESDDDDISGNPDLTEVSGGYD